MLSHRTGAYSALIPYRPLFSSTVAALLAVLLQCQSLIAAPFYGVNLTGGGQSISGPTEVHLSVAKYGGELPRDYLVIDEYGNYAYKTAFGRAGPAGLRASANGTVYLPDIREIDRRDVFTTQSMEASVAFRFDDMVISGPGTDPVPASLTLPLDGHLSANSFNVNGESASATAWVGLTGQVQSTANVFSGSVQKWSTNDYGVQQEADGILSGYSGGEMEIITPEYFLPVNTPFSVIVNLETSAYASAFSLTGDNGLPKLRIAEAGSSLAFHMLRGSPLFELPDGYTANSQDGGIVDNRWTAIPGDIDFNGTVDRTDAALLAQSFGRQSASAIGDLDFDGATTLADLAILQSYLDVDVASSPQSPAPSIPEPSSLALLVSAFLAIVVIKCRG